MSFDWHIGNVDSKKFCVFRKPSEIGFYSLDGEGNFHDDNRQMKWINTHPNSPDLHLNWDLNEGYSQVVLKDREKSEKKKLLRWIMRHREKIQRVFYSPKSNGLKLDFVCSRSLLRKISATPYDNRNAWAICASKFKSVIYMRTFETDQHIYERKNETELEKRMTFWGEKFEKYMTSDSRNSEPNPSVLVNEMEAYHIVLKGQINGYTLLYSAEIDGKDPRHPQTNLNCDADFRSTDCYIELKTSKINTFNRGKYFRQKLLKWWLQSFIGGIPKILCGYRDDNGIVRKFETLFVEDIPEIAKDSWNGGLCVKFCYFILDFVKTCVKEDNPEIVYTFQYEPTSPYVKCVKLTTPGEYKVLHNWFTDDFQT